MKTLLGLLLVLTSLNVWGQRTLQKVIVMPGGVAAFSFDGKRIYTASDYFIRSFTSSGEKTGLGNTRFNYQKGIYPTKSGNLIAYEGTQNLVNPIVELFDSTLKSLHVFADGKFAGYSANDDFIIVVNYNKMTVIQTKAPYNQKEYPLKKNHETAAIYCPIKNLVYVGATDTIQVWDTDGQLVKKLHIAFEKFQEYKVDITNFDISDDGKFIAIAGSDITLWTADGQRIITFKMKRFEYDKKSVSSVKFINSGKALLAKIGSSICTYDLQGNMLDEISPEDPYEFGEIKSMELSKDGKKILLAGNKESTHLYSLERKPTIEVQRWTPKKRTIGAPKRK